MLKNLLLFIGILISILINFDDLSAETISTKPIKKPILSNADINKKLSKNIIKPIKKPKKDKKILVEEKKIIEIIKEKKLSFKIPKKKTNYSRQNNLR